MTSSGTEPQPGKTRTWWHPLLVNVLRWQLADHYRVEEEFNVGTKPLQIDVLLLRQTQGELPESVRRVLAGLAEYFNEYTLIEFKSPSDTLRAGDFQTFLAYAWLYRAQNQPLLEPHRLNLLVLAPRLTQPYRRELRVCGVTAESDQPGIWRLRGGAMQHAAWVVETEALADANHPVLAVFSPQLLAGASAVTQQLRQQGHAKLVAYVTQQIQQFCLLGELFAMQHLGIDEETKQIWRDIVSKMTLEERLEGLSPEDRLFGLSPEERERMIKLLQQPPHKKPRKRGKKG